MRTSGLALLIPWLLAAQPSYDAPIVRGVVLECDARPSGDLAIRTAGNEVLRYQFDARTYVQREERMIEAGRLAAGEEVEIVSDRTAGFPLRYARTIHVILPKPPPRPQRAGVPRPYNPYTESVRTGTLTFAGVVHRVAAGKLVLHTREAGDLAILLRADTRYLDEGQVVDAGSLKPNMRVFVRAGKSLYDEVEAYQVIWGSILAPR